MTLEEIVCTYENVVACRTFSEEEGGGSNEFGLASPLRIWYKNIIIYRFDGFIYDGHDDVNIFQ